MPSSTLPIAVVIVNYNGRGYIPRCLESLRQSTRRPAQIVVVDNASSDGSPEEIAARFPEVTLVRNPANAGFSSGVNVGLHHCAEAGAQAALLLNPDTEIAADALEQLSSAMARHPGAILSLFIGDLDDPSRSGSYAGTIVWWRGRMGARYLHTHDATGPREDERVGTASGCALLIPGVALERIGYFDERYFLYFEDADFLERASASGVELWYVPAARILHREGSATGGSTSPLALYYYVRNRHLFVRKFRGRSAVYACFLIYSLFDAGARAALWVARGRADLARAVVRGAAHGWLGVMGQDRRQSPAARYETTFVR
jgi:GT2 family glycosyltransferase